MANLFIRNEPEKIPQQPLYLLIVEDTIMDVELITIALETAGVNFTYDQVDTAVACQELLQAQSYDAVLSDYRLPTTNGLQVLKLLQQSRQDIPLILVTGTLGEEAAVECIKAGMTDYVMKERLFRLPSVLARSLTEFELRRQKQTAIAQLQSSAWREATINRIVQMMRGTLVLNEVLQTTVDQLHEALHVSRCLIFKPSPDGEMRVCHVSEATIERQHFIGINCKIAQYHRDMLERGSPLVLDRISSNLPPECQDLAQKYNISSLMVAPLRYQQSFLGGITLHYDQEREWSLDELALLTAIADQCAIAIHQAQLYEQAQTELAERKRMGEALRQAEVKYRSIFENALEGIFQVTPEGHFLSANPALARIYGYESPEQLIFHPDNLWAQLYVDPHRLNEFIAAMQQQGEVSCFECQIYRCDGSTIWISQNARAVGNETGRLIYYEGSVEDITEHKQTESLLVGQTRMLELLVNDAPLTQVLDVLCEMVEAHSEGLMCSIFLTDKSSVSLRCVAAPSWHSIPKSTSIEFDLAHACWSTPIVSESGKILGTFTMYSRQPRQPTPRECKVLEIATRLAGVAIERKQAEQQLQYDAFHDSLTNLYNRAWFMKQLQQALKQFQSQSGYGFAVLFLDLDEFKVINDSLGHLVGDRLLVAIASRLQDCLNSNHTVARLGGDEFAILIENVTDLNQVGRLAEQLKQYVKIPLTIDAINIFPSVSIGIALSAANYKQPEELLRDADIALYRAKQQGKNRAVVFDRTMHEQALARLELETALRQAIERQELLLHYQPIISLHTGKIVGFEALVRWQHPERGLISPSEFIPIAEETGLIIPLGWWVLREACHRLQVWQVQFPYNLPLKMSVNLSGKQFAQTNLVEQLNKILLEMGCEPENLKLEITESTLMEGGKLVVKMMEQLQKLGIELCIDDFGTGYSSLSRLHQLPINTLKIDRSFVRRMGDNSENTEIVRSIVSLGHNLGMDIIAEGVEESPQLILLRELECEYGQGYLFAKPLSHQAAANLITASPQW